MSKEDFSVVSAQLHVQPLTFGEMRAECNLSFSWDPSKISFLKPAFTHSPSVFAATRIFQEPEVKGVSCEGGKSQQTRYGVKNKSALNKLE